MKAEDGRISTIRHYPLVKDNASSHKAIVVLST